MATKKQLIQVAEELNEVLGLEPAISLDSKPEELKGKISQAIALLTPEDELTEASAKILDEEFPNWDGEPEPDPVEEEDEPEEAGEDESSVPEPVEKPKKAPKPPKAEKKAKKVTKKSIILEMTSQKTGATIEEMAQAITDSGIDPDLEKNKKIVKLWLSKMGFDTKKASIAANPKFKSA